MKGRRLKKQRGGQRKQVPVKSCRQARAFMEMLRWEEGELEWGSRTQRRGRGGNKALKSSRNSGPGGEVGGNERGAEADCRS